MYRRAELTPVMVEKPVTPTVAEAEELAALAKSKNLVFCVYQNRRWDADFLTLKKVLEEGTVSCASGSGSGRSS